MSKFLDTVSWPKAALLGGVALLVVGMFHPPTVERVMAFVERIVRILATSFGG